MSDYLGDFLEDATVRRRLTTHDKNGGAVAPSTAFEAADFKIYKNADINQKTTTNGVTLASPFDSITGLHLLSLDTSVDTGDAGFWVAGAEYCVVLDPDETVDSETVVRAWHFSIENRSNIIPNSPTDKKIELTATGGASINWGDVQNPTTTNALTGTTVDLITDAVDSTSLANDAITAAKIAANAIGASEIADGAIDAATFAAGAIDAAAIANAAIDAATFAAGAIDASAIATDAITAAKIAANAITSSELADNAITAAKIAADAITAAKIATDAIGADEIADNAIDAGAIAAGALNGKGDWLTADRHLILDTTIATLSSQTQFTLTAGSADDDAYINCTIVIEDAATAEQKALGVIADYTGSTKTVDLRYDPGIFTMAATDKVYILGDISAKMTLPIRPIDADSSGTVNANIVTAAANTINASALADDAANEIARKINPQKNSAFSNITFEMYDSTNHNPSTGLTVAGERSIDGGAYSAVGGTIAEISDGTYQFDAAAADMNGDMIVFRFNATGADDTFVHVKTAL